MIIGLSEVAQYRIDYALGSRRRLTLLDQPKSEWHQRHRSTAYSLPRARPRACVGAMRWFRRKHNQPWEVVGCETVEPVTLILRSRGVPANRLSPEIDIVHIGANDLCRTYIFDFKRHAPDGDQCANALLFSQQQLLQEVAKKHYNVLLLEGWTLARLRQGKWHRIEIDYIGRAGYVSGKPPALRRPPFIAVLQGQRSLS
ncbi:hypothetical protein J3R82DRAFT_1116 [Butyriboletus roseoflavus]|nr:hypothetical protein J3R82DRAFT_1116 [Butyriboletus roseoflavus]